MAAIAAVLAATPVARSGTSVPPSWWVADALCVHSGWHYTDRRPRPSKPVEYVLWGHGYWRTSKTWSNGEGVWTAANEGYGGGLQMDATFQLNYGPEFLRQYGPAGRWPISVQLQVAYRGWQVQGWGAWPNTSRACGLR